MSQVTRRDGPVETLQGSVEQVWLAGLGALALTEEEGSKFFHSLVKKGEVVEKKSKARLDDVVSVAKKVPATAISTIERRTDETFKQVMQRLGIPTRKDIDLRLIGGTACLVPFHQAIALRADRPAEHLAWEHVVGVIANASGRIAQHRHETQPVDRLRPRWLWHPDQLGEGRIDIDTRRELLPGAVVHAVRQGARL